MLSAELYFIIILPMTAKTSRPFFSIIIPTLNEEKYLPKLLGDLSKQTYPLASFEVIHIDAMSEDKTIELAGKSAGKLNFTTYTVKKRNVAHQRNFGAKKAQGRWVIYMDADDRLPKYFLQGICYQISKFRKMDLFTTMVLPEKNTPAYQTLVRALNVLIVAQNKIGPNFAWGGMLGLKRNLAQKYRFKEHLVLGEDHNLVRALIKDGYKFEVLSDPQFTISLRRQRKDGLLKSGWIQANVFINSIFKEELTEDYGYVMLGGQHYQAKSKEQLAKKLGEKITHFTQQQKDKIRQILETLKPLY